MHAGTIRDLVRTEPFKPFKMHLAEGRKIVITDPMSVALFGNGRDVFIAYPKSDRVEYVNFLFVNSIEVGGKVNGGGRKKRAA